MGNLTDHLVALSEVPSRAAKEIAAGLNEELADQFDRGVDPYGNPWAKLAERTLLKHGEPPLQAEFGGGPGPLAEGTMAQAARGAGVSISVPFPGGIHQTGARKGAWRMPARKILPEGGELPPAWRQVIDKAIGKAFKKGGRRGA